MSPSRRDKSSSRRPRRAEAEAEVGGDALIPIDDDAAELIPVGEDDNELDTLEEWSPADEVEITCAPASEDRFDVRVTIAVGDMEKSAITAAIEAPLRDKISEFAHGLRWRRVVVTFTGEAMIPTAAKDLIGAILPECKPLSVTVQRGYPDEVVHQGTPPSLTVTTSGTATEPRVDVDTSGLDPVDFEAAWQPELDKLCASAAGQVLSFRFSGGPAPSAEALCEPLVTAGAVRITRRGESGDEVLYDREIAELVTIDSDADGRTTVTVGAGKDPETTQQALATVLQQNSEQITGKAVEVKFEGGAATAEQIDALRALSAAHRPATLETDGDVLWPPLLAVTIKGNETAVQMNPAARDPKKALERELPGVSLAGQRVTWDWPAGMAVDPALEQRLIAAGPAALAYSFAGEDREPIWPVPMSIRTEGDECVIELDTAAGKPVELVRVMQRYLPDADVAGKNVAVHMQGDGTVSRTMRRTLIEALETGGAAQARLVDHGTTEILFPGLLTVTALADGDHRVEVSIAGRDQTQIAEAAASELESLDLAGSTIRLQSTDADTQLVEIFLARGAARLILEAGEHLQIHPTLFADASSDGDQLTIIAAPDADDDALLVQLRHELPVILEQQGDMAAVTVTLAWPGDETAARAETLAQLLAAGPAVLRLDDGQGEVEQLHPKIVRTYVDVLGRRDTGTPPMIMIGVDTDDVDGASAALENMLDQLEGRRVLIVFRDGEREISGAHDDPMVRATHAIVGPRAQAELHFRQAARGAPAHFKVVASKIEGLALGAKVRDPRTAT